MQNIKTINRLTEGSIIKSILLLALPILLGNLLQTAYQITDTFWVGRLGAEAIAAVSLSFPVIFLITALSGGVGMAGAVLVAQYKGRGDNENIDKIAAQTFLLALLASVFFSIIGLIFAPMIIKILGAQPEVLPLASSYLRISFLGLVAIFGYMVFQSLIRGVGNVKVPVYILLITVLLNIVLDPLFIFGYGSIPAMGVAGAAMATVTTQSIALIIGLSLLVKGKSGIHLKWNNFKPNKLLMVKIIKLGIPTSLEQSSRSFGFILMAALAASFGTIVLAAYGIGIQMIALVIIPALSLSIANSTLVGQNIGADKKECAARVAKISTTIGFASLTIIGIIFFLLARQISNIFIPNDPEVVRMSTTFIRIVSLAFGLIGVQMSMFGALRGAGNTSTTMKIAIAILIIQIGSAFILSKLTPLSELGLWISFPLGNIVGATISLFIFKQKKWLNKNLIK